MNNKGPKMDPCGTPQWTGLCADDDDWYWTYFQRL